MQMCIMINCIMDNYLVIKTIVWINQTINRKTKTIDKIHYNLHYRKTTPIKHMVNSGITF